MDNIKNCRFCQSRNTKKLFSSFNSHGRKIININDRFNIRKCLDCHDVYVDDIKIDQNYYDKYYGYGYHSDVEGLGRSLNYIWSLIYGFIFKKREKNIKKFFKNKKDKISILDIGCGNGTFLSGLDERKFEKNGQDINAESIEMICKKGINVYDKPIEQINFGSKKFDCITLWQVIEHLSDPRLMFDNIHKIMHNDGVLIFQVPNNNCMGLKYGKDYWFHMDSPRHLFIPDRHTINQLCLRTGFEIVKIENEFYDYPLDLLWSIRRSPIRFLIYPLYPIFKIISREHLTFFCKKI